MLVHAQGDPLALTNAVRQAVSALDRNLPIYAVAALLLVTGVAAAAIPARRASRVDPMWR